MSGRPRCSEFLLTDFAQSFEQLRHYDELQQSLLKFAFGGYVAVATGLVAVSKLPIDQGQGFNPLLSGVVVVWTVTGLLVLAALARVRVYFVFTARYVTEIRCHAFSEPADSFANATGMHINCSKPPFFNPLSSQSFGAYFLMVLNAAGAASAVWLAEGPVITWEFYVAGTAVMALQFACYLMYLRAKEGRTCEQGVFPG